MDLTVNDLSKLLQVSDEAILNWIQQGKIPSYQIQDEYRFNRVEIEEWLWRFLDQDEEQLGLKEHPMGLRPFSLYRAIHKGFVLEDVEGDSKEEILRHTMDLIADKLDLNAETFTNLLIDREKLSSTAINHGVAVPHARELLLSKAYDVIAVVYLKKPMDWGALDGEKIHTLFFLFASEDSRHLNLLGKIAYFCHQRENVELLQQAPDKKALMSAVRLWESSLSLLQPV